MRKKKRNVQNQIAMYVHKEKEMDRLLFENHKEGEKKKNSEIYWKMCQRGVEDQ